MAAFANNRSFDLRTNNPIFDKKKGRKRTDFSITPQSMEDIEVSWSPHVRSAYRSKILCNIPVEYLALFSHADTDAALTLTGRDIVTREEIKFRPTNFESTDSKEFKLVDLFTVQLTSQNRIDTQFRAFSDNWNAMINSLPWRHNEVMCLLSIYRFIESQFYSKEAFKVTLDELVKECAKILEKKEYIRNLYSLLVIQDTEMFIVDSNKKLLIPKKKLFEINASNTSICSLAEELENIGNKSSKELLNILSQFEVNFNKGALGDIERLHKHETGQLPPNFTLKQNGSKPNYWKPRVYKSGHLFHTLNPHLNVSPVLIRAWALLNAMQPQPRNGYRDLVKGFGIDSFSAICGLSIAKERNQNRFKDYLSEISKYWGGLETKGNNIFIKYGFDQKVMDSLKSNDVKNKTQSDNIKIFDLKYGELKDDTIDDNIEGWNIHLFFKEKFSYFFRKNSLPFKNQYIICQNETNDEYNLLLINSSGIATSLISDTKIFTLEVNNLKIKDDEKIISINHEQFAKIVTSNGGHKPNKNLNIKTISLDSLKEALMKQHIREDDAEALAEQIKLKEFGKNKSTGKEVLPVHKEIPQKTATQNEVDKKPKQVALKNDKVKTSNDLSKNALIARIEFLKGKTIAGNNGDELRKQFLKALEGGINQSVISMKLEQIERFIQ